MVTPQTKGKDGSHPVKILALESSAVAASAALCEDETLIAQAFQNSGLTHSQTLLPMVDHLLQGPGGPGPHRRGGGPRVLYRAAHRGCHRQRAGLGRPAPLRRLLHPGVHGLEPGWVLRPGLRRHGCPPASNLQRPVSGGWAVPPPPDAGPGHLSGRPGSGAGKDPNPSTGGGGRRPALL